MRKVVSCLLLITLVLTIIGCGSKPEIAEEKNGAKGQTGDKIAIKLAHVEPEDRSVHKACMEFKEYLEEKTNGQVSVEVYPNAQLGGDRQAVEGVSVGTIEIAVAASAVMSGYDPKFGVLDLPYIFKNREATYKACDGAVGEKLNSLLPPLGMIGLGYNDNGQRHITNNVKPINEPADMKGIKIRVMENPVYIDMFRTLGANPTPMSFGEVYTALQQKTVDAQENPVALIYASKFQEVQEYLSLTGHTYSFNIVVMNKDFYDSLPSEIQTLVKDGAKKFLVDKQRQLEAADDNASIEKLKQAGMIVNQVTPENMEKFVEAMKPVHEKYATTIGEELINLAIAANE